MATIDRRKWLISSSIAVLGLTRTVSVHAGRLCCVLCGADEEATKVCRLVCVEKKITVVCYSCEGEDICLPGPHLPNCQHWDPACGTEDECRGFSGRYQRFFVWSHWTPCGCGKIVTKKRLQKKIATKMVPSYKWVVEDLCPQCESNCDPVKVTADAVIPPAPAVSGAKIIGAEIVDPPK